MIFHPPMIRAILAGRKTTTRRPVKAGERECRYKPGRTYAIQPGRTKPASAHILITSIHVQPLGTFSYHDARAEGFPTQRDFYDHWLQLYGHIDPDQNVWVITFQLEQDRPRFLTPAARPHGTERGYTTNRHNALEPVEAVPAEFQAQITKEARGRFATDRRGEMAGRRLRSLVIQLKDAERKRDFPRAAAVAREIVQLEQDAA